MAGELLHEFIAHALSRSAVRLELRQRLAVGSGETRVRDWTREEIRDRSTETICADVFAAAEADAETQRGPARYCVLAYRDGEGSYFARRLFVVRGSPADDVTESEEPNNTGLMAQLMRHSEAKERLTWGMISELMRMQSDTVRGLQEQLSRTMRRHFEVLELHEQLVSAGHDRELATAEAKRKERQQDMVMEKLGVLVPALMTRILGPAGAAGGLAGEEMLHGLLASMRQDQVERILPTLEPEQVAAFAQLYEVYKAREKANKGEP